MSVDTHLDIDLDLHAGYRLLGRGAFGEVWEAEAPDSTRAALKFLPCDLSLAAVHELRSVQIVRQLNHPHLVRVDKDWSAPGCLILAMELANGSLADLLDSYQTELGTALPPEDLCPLLAQVAEALDFLNAPQPLLILLGTLLDDLVPADVYQRHREPPPASRPAGQGPAPGLPQPARQGRHVPLRPAEPFSGHPGGPVQPRSGHHSLHRVEYRRRLPGLFARKHPDIGGAVWGTWVQSTRSSAGPAPTPSAATRWTVSPTAATPGRWAGTSPLCGASTAQPGITPPCFTRAASCRCRNARVAEAEVI